MEKAVGKVVRVRVRDHRIVCGLMSCFDKEGNIILDDAVEIRPPQKPGSDIRPLKEFATDKPILLGQIMISGKDVLGVDLHSTE